MENYFEAAIRTDQRITGMIEETALELTKEGFHVFLPKGVVKTFFVAFRNGTQIHLEWHRIPREWVFMSRHKPNKKTGSSYRMAEYNGEKPIPNIETIFKYRTKCSHDTDVDFLIEKYGYLELCYLPIETEGKNPYYIAWTITKPKHAQIYRYCLWIQERHRQFKKEVLKRKDNEFDMGFPYSKDEQEQFTQWLFQYANDQNKSQL